MRERDRGESERKKGEGWGLRGGGSGGARCPSPDEIILHVTNTVEQKRGFRLHHLDISF